MMKKVRTRAQNLLNALGYPDAELSVLIVDDSEMAGLSADYLGKRKPTNVLSFPMQEGEGAGVAPGLLGDIVISADTAFEEAQKAKQSLSARMAELLIHGLLHLAGYDHATKEEKIRMETKAAELSAIMDIENG
ncbi:MAG: rRNA maturation RNase YbeY [Thermodesulfobacteriota bacterium]